MDRKREGEMIDTQRQVEKAGISVSLIETIP